MAQATGEVVEAAATADAAAGQRVAGRSNRRLSRTELKRMQVRVSLLSYRSLPLCSRGFAQKSALRAPADPALEVEPPPTRLCGLFSFYFRNVFYKKIKPT